ncbi:MAG: flavodoxin family protein [Verrucomicrobiota bacterium]|nr:flavodoxin family protein [Verrucomicrobiota bacterium]
MKGAVIYSSKTGNTKKVAEAILEGCNEKFKIYSVNDDLDLADFEFIFMGYWVDKGTADKKALEFMQDICHKKVAIFATLGAYPNSDHAKKSLEAGAKCLGEGCSVIDNFICQGAIDPKLMEWMNKLPEDHPHAPDEERIKRWKDASTRPDKNDLNKATEFAKNVLKNI